MTKTILHYADIIELNDMVNQKKHDKLICIISDEKKEFLIEDEKLKMIIPIEGKSGGTVFLFNQDLKFNAYLSLDLTTTIKKWVNFACRQQK